MAGAAANCVTDMFMALLRVARRGRAQTAHHEVNPIAVLVMAVLIAEGLRDELLLGEVCLRAANWARRVESLSHAAADCAHRRHDERAGVSAQKSVATRVS